MGFDGINRAWPVNTANTVRDILADTSLGNGPISSFRTGCQGSRLVSRVVRHNKTPSSIRHPPPKTIGSIDHGITTSHTAGQAVEAPSVRKMRRPFESPGPPVPTLQRKGPLAFVQVTRESYSSQISWTLRCEGPLADNDPRAFCRVRLRLLDQFPHEPRDVSFAKEHEVQVRREGAFVRPAEMQLGRTSAVG